MKIQVLKDGPSVEVVDNSFCPTGKGGGVDPSCGGANSSISFKQVGIERRKAFSELLMQEIPVVMKELTGKTWWTPTELADQLKEYGTMKAQVPFISGRVASMHFKEVKKSERRRVVESVLKKIKNEGKLETVLGSDSGKETRVYALKERVN